jgi:radical SAM superfamily enzyme YgiQ (UPF0313 family)
MDIDAEGIKDAEFADIVKQKDYDIVGFTVTTPTFWSSVKLSKQVKRHNPRSVTIFGGIHPTIRPLETAEQDSVDIVVRGEGEITFMEIVENLKHKRGLSNIKGLVYKKDGKIEETPPRPLIEDLNSLPFPARHLFKNKKYVYPDSLYSDAGSIMTSRGCPGMCTYCNARQIFKRTFRARTAGNVADEIEFLVKKLRKREIHIWDDNFTTDKKRVLAIRDELKKRALKAKFAFPNGIRADFLNRDVLAALKDMGVYSIALGIESGSQEILNRAHKGIKLEKIEEVMALAKEMRLETWAFFIIGLPGENARTMRQTIDFAGKINPDIAKFHILKPYPGTEVYDDLRARKFILTEDYDKFGIHTPAVHRLEEFTPDDMLEWQRRAYASFYLKPAKIAGQLLRIKTLNRFIVNLDAGIGLFKMYLWKKPYS